jgi:drug/metabolite transporter (DMT)-like permease
VSPKAAVSTETAAFLFSVMRYRMSVPAAYLGIILIWSTTPLAVKWSGEGPGFIVGAAGRMALGALLCLLIARLAGVRLPWHREAVRAYAAAAVGIYGAMTCVYWGAQYLPSGLVSVLFGLSPIVVGAMASLWLEERSFTPVKVAGSLIGLAGLMLIFGGHAQLGARGGLALIAVLGSVFLHSASSVWVKRAGEGMDALALTTGGLLLSLPCYLVTWLVLDPHWPAELPPRALGAIVYLGTLGSGVGFGLYYYVLRRIEAGRAALIPLVTPVMALMLGHWLNGETVEARALLGAALILSGLLFYELGERLIGLLGRTRDQSPEL